MKPDNLIFNFINEKEDGKIVSNRFDKAPFNLPLTPFGSLDIERLQRESKGGPFCESVICEIKVPNPINEDGRRALLDVTERMGLYYRKHVENGHLKDHIITRMEFIKEQCNKRVCFEIDMMIDLLKNVEFTLEPLEPSSTESESQD